MTNARRSRLGQVDVVRRGAEKGGRSAGKKRRMNDDELEGIREDVHKLEGRPFRYILHMA